MRAGLHTGECEVRGDDIGGIAVHIGSRVSGLAGANEVLVSSTLRDLVIGSGLEFEERAAHVLKGVPGEWHCPPSTHNADFGQTHSPARRQGHQEIGIYFDSAFSSVWPGRFVECGAAPSWSSPHPYGRAL